MANLLVDVGYTALKASWADGITLGKTFRYQGERTFDFIAGLVRKDRPENMVVCSVSEINEQTYCRLRKLCDRLIVIDPVHNEIFSELSLPQSLTPDRAASAVACRHLFKGRGCSIFDFGTMMTVDFLDTDGNYAGGNISLGCRTRFKSVNRYSRTFPLLDTPDDFKDMGITLQESISSGVVLGMKYEIEGYIDRYPENIVIFTGGDANYFAKIMKNSIFVVCNLVLMGLSLIAVKYDDRQ
ncbi:MAG: type III pantothenate kinase [Candidatus Cryptobacteroides sp.]